MRGWSHGYPRSVTDRARSGHRPPLGAHRLLGQGNGAALVRPTGEVDWWCPNHFDATPLLWSLLDPRGGSASWDDTEMATWDAHPAGPTTHTVLRHRDGRICLWDGLACIGGTDVLVRLVRAEASACALTHRLSCGGFDAPWEQWELSGHPAAAHVTVFGGDAHEIVGPMLLSRVVAQPDRWNGIAIASVAGIDVPHDPEELVTLLQGADDRQARVLQDVRLPYHHPSRVVDALRVLRAVTDKDTGAPVASPTTSLPEALGGTRQFDYRFTWLRDSANSVAVAALLGHIDASAAYLRFIGTLLDAADGHLTPLTTTKGRPVPLERDVPGVAGWGASLPIRVGNAAAEQRQIDAVAAVLEAIWVNIECGGRMSASTWSIVERLADLIVNTPFQPSSGVWEIRAPQYLVSEELARWVGLDRAIRLKRRFRPWLRRPRWARDRQLAGRRVAGALDPDTGMLPQVFGEATIVPDASSLLAAINGFFPRNDPRLARLVRSTIAALEEGAFLRRYPPQTDGFVGVEGAFVPASWWAVSALAIIGDLDDAERRADDMCAHLPPLQPEEWNVENDEGLGNTPAALVAHGGSPSPLQPAQRTDSTARRDARPACVANDPVPPPPHRRTLMLVAVNRAVGRSAASRCSACHCSVFRGSACQCLA